jgi:hypothetical protein
MVVVFIYNKKAVHCVVLHPLKDDEGDWGGKAN